MWLHKATECFFTEAIVYVLQSYPIQLQTTTQKTLGDSRGCLITNEPKIILLRLSINIPTTHYINSVFCFDMKCVSHEFFFLKYRHWRQKKRSSYVITVLLHKHEVTYSIFTRIFLKTLFLDSETWCVGRINLLLICFYLQRFSFLAIFPDFFSSFYM